MTVVEVHCASPHYSLTPIYAGLAELARSDQWDVRWQRSEPYRSGSTAIESLHLVVDGVHRVVVDGRDGPALDPSDMDWCTVYLKRSYALDLHGSDLRVRPLGLLHMPAGPASWRWRLARWSVQESVANRNRAAALRGVTLAVPPRVLRLIGLDGTATPHSERDFVHAPRVRDCPTVFHVSRVWDYRRVTGEKAEEWHAINEQRAGCVRALRRELGSSFIGGLAPTELARDHYADCLVDDCLIDQRATLSKTRFLQLLQASDVSVAVAGLRRSIGSGLTEAVASSRCVVTERLAYEVPGPFEEGTNFLSFEDPHDCVAAVLQLLEDPTDRLAMMRCNSDYFRGWVRAAELVRNAVGRLDD